MEEHDRPLLVSDPQQQAASLRRRFDEWGYLYFPGALAADRCGALLAELLDVLGGHLRIGRDGVPELRGAPFAETDAIWDVLYPRMQALESFHGLFHEAATVELMRTVAGAEVFVYPMKMARLSTPGRVGHETPPHQDAHSHHAGARMAGIWIALHDVEASMGRLKLLPKSHLRGLRPVGEALGVGGVQCQIFADEHTWHVSDLRQGDVIIFHSCMVHKAEPNTDASRVRMSVDTRFCDYGAPVFATNVEPHHGWRIPGLGWESIYAGWHSTESQYYWRDYPGLFTEYGKHGQPPLVLPDGSRPAGAGEDAAAGGLGGAAADCSPAG